MKRKASAAVFFSLLITMLLGCTDDVDAKEGLSAWTEEKVLTFLSEVDQYLKDNRIPVETASKEPAIKIYEKYFVPELSRTIVDSFYDKTDTGWKIPDSDAGYHFILPQKGEDGQSQLTFEFGKDAIRVRQTYETGMFTTIEYTIGFSGKPMIIDWKQN